MLDYEIVLANEWLTASIDPLGAVVTRLVHKPTGLHWLFEAPSRAAREQSPFIYGLVPLFPPGRIRGGRFALGGWEYQWPVNDPSGHANLHGVGFNRVWEVDGRHAEGVRLRLDQDRCPEFGAPFSLVLEYRLSDRALVMEAELVNTGAAAPIPAALGYHINVDLTACDYRCQWPPRIPWEVDGHLIPTGRRGPMRGRDTVAAREVVEDQPYRLVAGRFEPVALTAVDQGVRVVLDASSEFGQLVIYRPSRDARFLSVEPYTWVPNAPNLTLPPAETGLVALAPGAAQRWRATVTFIDDAQGEREEG
ncbi:MAG: hypothetical protein OWU84_12270 [Firmicutes bacterium]|nr:hypothetical protein [Bacillota bacterium]